MRKGGGGVSPRAALQLNQVELPLDLHSEVFQNPRSFFLGPGSSFESLLDGSLLDFDEVRMWRNGSVRRDDAGDGDDGFLAPAATRCLDFELLTGLLETREHALKFIEHILR